MSLDQRLNSLKAELTNRADPTALQLAVICEELYVLVEQLRGDLTEAYEAQVRVDQRLNALEKRLPGYQEPRG